MNTCELILQRDQLRATQELFDKEQQILKQRIDNITDTINKQIPPQIYITHNTSYDELRVFAKNLYRFMNSMPISIHFDVDIDVVFPKRLVPLKTLTLDNYVISGITDLPRATFKYKHFGTAYNDYNTYNLSFCGVSYINIYLFLVHIQKISFN